MPDGLKLAMIQILLAGLMLAVSELLNMQANSLTIVGTLAGAMSYALFRESKSPETFAEARYKRFVSAWASLIQVFCSLPFLFLRIDDQLYSLELKWKFFTLGTGFVLAFFASYVGLGMGYKNALKGRKAKAKIT